MKSAINFYYNLFPEEIINQENFYFFNVGEDKFYFAPFNNEEKVVEIVYEEMVKRKLKVNNVIKNKDGKISTLVNEQNFALIRVNCLEKGIVELEDFFKVSIPNYSANWGEVWSNKLDYYAYQVSERALKKEALLNSFSYYVGLSENAISYYNMIDISNVNVLIQHRRIYNVNYEINYFNPLNMVIDFGVRDLAEYIKFSFFADTLNVDRVVNYINKESMNDGMINLLFARLLFPTYYFDVYDKVVNDETSENELIKIIDKCNDYEKFLRDFYLYYSKTYNMFRVEWLIKT